jgi:protoporphyrinogen oxidase
MSGKDAKIVIIGGGLSGLSTAFFLEKPLIILEKNDTLGGLCSSYTEDGFTFDYTGHLLHFSKDWTKAFVKKLLSGNLKRIERNAAIFSHRKFTPYPFQANTYGLPPKIVKESLLGFIQTLINPKTNIENDNYEKWIFRTFGSGIAEHFMLPYNRKLWCHDLCSISTDWVSQYIPKPTLEMVLDGALGIRTHTLGYNASFYYPTTGGIQKLIDGFALSVKNVYTGIEPVSIDIDTKIIKTSDGSHYDYDILVSTIPLVKLLGLIKEMPEPLKSFIPNLRYVSVLNLNIGISREKISPYHWIYFPEKDFVFYRCGFPTNFSDSLAPPKTSSIYVEISSQDSNRIDEKEAYRKTIDGLIDCGVLKSESEIIHKSIRYIEYGYVLYNHERNKVLNQLLEFLKKHKIISIGRYGAWEYSAMEESILWGKNTAEKIAVGIF